MEHVEDLAISTCPDTKRAAASLLLGQTPASAAGGPAVLDRTARVGSVHVCAPGTRAKL